MVATLQWNEVEWDEAAFDRFFKSPGGPLGQQMDVWGSMIASTATMLTTNVMVQVQSGRLSGSITHVVLTDPETGELSLNVGSDVEYAGYVHDGTRYMDGRPYLTTALEMVVAGIAAQGPV